MAKESDAGQTILNQEKQSGWSGHRSRFGQSNKWQFDHINSPVDACIPRPQVAIWIEGLEDVSITPYLGVAWRASGPVPQ